VRRAPIGSGARWSAQGDSVRETAMASRDGGKTWAPLFDLLFRPHGR